MGPAGLEAQNFAFFSCRLGFAREPKRAHLSPAASNTTKIQREDSHGEKKTTMGAGEETKSEISGGPAEGGPAEGGPAQATTQKMDWSKVY